jgi:hypothetical protein
MPKLDDPFKELRAEYERQVVLCAKQSEEYVQRLHAFAKEHPELEKVAQRLLSQHLGWV